MRDKEKTKEQLIGELEKSRQRAVELESKFNLSVENLKISEKRIRAWLEYSPVCTKIVDLDFNLQYMSIAGVKALKIDDITQYYGKPYPRDFYPESAYRLIKNNLGRVKESCEILTQETPAVDVNGSELWFYTTYVPVYDDKHQIDSILVVSADITERKQTEAELHQYEKIVSSSKDMLAILDKNCTYLAANDSYLSAFGLQKNNLLNHTPKEIFGQEVFEKVIQPHAKICLEGKEVHYEGWVDFPVIGKKYIEINYLPHEIENGEVAGFVVNGRDITERKEAEERIRILSQAIEQSPVSVMITDTDSNIEFVNSTFEKVTGYHATEVVGQNPRLLKSGKTPKSYYKEMWQKITSGKTWKGEFQNKKKNGETLWEYTYISPVVDETGAISHYLAVNEDITYRKRQEEELLHQAQFDRLTELPNRFLALDRLSQLILESQRTNTLVAVLFLDLDDFKKINDTMGHLAGDKLLLEVAGRLNRVTRSCDTLGRLGGDEFIVLISGVLDTADICPPVENLIRQFQDAFRINDHELILTASIGIAVFPKDGDNASKLLQNADSAMYHAKDLGRNTYAFYTDSMNQEVSRRLELEEQLRAALARGEMTVSYQPQIDVSSGRIVGAEALLRWNNTALGQVSPEEFIPVAEKTGLIIPLGKFVLITALGMVMRMNRDFDPKFYTAVNLSPLQFRDPDLVPFIEKAIDQSGVSGEHLELEITEGVLMSGHDYVDRELSELSKMGISISMDDFGTGYSSLSYLRSYPFDVLKIDKSFVNDITIDPSGQALINATIAMAHGLNLKVVAEGVETEEQLVYLKKQGCDYAQGYLFAKPMSEDDFLEWVSNWDEMPDLT